MTAATAGAYPASFSVDAPERVANWRPLVHWLLAIPHFAVLYALNLIAEIAGLVSWFVILFTGKDIEGLQGVRMMYLRYSTRTALYAGFMVEEYPPFAFSTTGADPGDVPRVRVDITPQLEGRNRVTTFFRLILAIPHLLAIAVLGIGMFVCFVLAFFAVLFTGRWPAGLQEFVLKVMRWVLRFQAYLMLLTDEYPPFSLD
jgi:hypothetical protein